MAHRVLNGISYRVNGVEVYRDAGAVIDDLAPGLAKIFLADGCIEEVEPRKATPKKVTRGSDSPSR